MKNNKKSETLEHQTWSNIQCFFAKFHSQITFWEPSPKRINSMFKVYVHFWAAILLFLVRAHQVLFVADNLQDHQKFDRLWSPKVSDFLYFFRFLFTVHEGVGAPGGCYTFLILGVLVYNDEYDSAIFFLLVACKSSSWKKSKKTILVYNIFGCNLQPPIWAARLVKGSHRSQVAEDCELRGFICRIPASHGVMSFKTRRFAS